MASKMSKKKPNGCRAIRLVQRAAQKCHCTIREFFLHASRIGNVSKGLPVLEETESFCRVANEGTIVLPGYKVPQHVLDLAERVRTVRDPRPLLKAPTVRLY